MDTPSAVLDSPDIIRSCILCRRYPVMVPASLTVDACGGASRCAKDHASDHRGRGGLLHLETSGQGLWTR